MGRGSTGNGNDFGMRHRLGTFNTKFDHSVKNSIISNKDPVKSILLTVKDIAYNPDVKAIIVFSNSGKSAKLISAMRPAAKIVTKRVDKMQTWTVLEQKSANAEVFKKMFQNVCQNCY